MEGLGTVPRDLETKDSASAATLSHSVKRADERAFLVGASPHEPPIAWGYPREAAPADE